MIYLKKCKGDVLKKIKALKGIIPEYIEDNGNTENPFMIHIEEKGSINEDLLEFLYHSDYLENMDEKTLIRSICLYDNNADTGWYEFLKNIYDEEEKEGDAISDMLLEYMIKGLSYESAINCYENWNRESIDTLKDDLSRLISYKDEAISVPEIEKKENEVNPEDIDNHDATLETEEEQETSDNNGIINEKTDIEVVPTDKTDPEEDISKMVEQIEMERVRKADDLLSHSYKVLFDQQKNYTDRLNKELVEAEEKYKTVSLEKDKLTEQITEIFNNLENSYSIGQESKREAIQLKAENERLRLRLESKDKFIERNNQKNVEYISKIQELESEVEDQRITIEELRDKLSGCEAELEERTGSLEDMKKQLNEMSIAAENYRQELENLKKDEEALIKPGNDSLSGDNENYYDDPDDYSNGADTGNGSETVSFNKNQDGVEDYSIRRENSFEYSDVREIKSEKETVRKKSSWFTNLMIGFSKFRFSKMDRKRQENAIKEKMMKMSFPIENAKLVRESLKKYGEKVPCFDLYEFISSDPSREDIQSYFEEFDTDEEVSLDNR